MYYIVNLNKQVIAADSDFLSFLEIDSLEELFTKVASNRLSFNKIDSNTLEIASNTGRVTLTQKEHPLSTLMGDLLLIEVIEPQKSISSPVDLPKSEENEVKILIDNKEDDFFKLDLEPSKEADDKINLLEKEEKELINPLPDEKINFLKPAQEVLIIEDDEDDFVLSEKSIVIDSAKISKELGISQEDFSGFLDEFIDTAIEQEEAIKDTENIKHDEAIASLRKLSQILHLTALSDILESVEKHSGSKEKKAIEAFYHTLSNLTTHAFESTDSIPKLEPEKKEETCDNQICDLVLSNIKPIHFDFQLERAANELSLPVDLIEEFVNDFIVQANEEKQTFIDACKRGDIDTIHKTGHKLKGAASNLRIIPLAETLEEIQLCEDKSRFEPLLKKYWGQFLAFEIFMRNISHK